VAALVGIGPKDEIEGMIAAKLSPHNNAAMECYRRAMIGSRVRHDGVVEIELGLGDSRLPKNSFTAAQMRQAEAAARAWVASSPGRRPAPALQPIGGGG
jgi:hypothetical protein